MIGSDFVFVLLLIGGAITIGIYLVTKTHSVNQLQNQISVLEKSVNDMDEQAKLIVRTDMELNKIQDELDKKIAGLYALQKLSRAISMTLEEDQIFKRIESEHLDALGFEKATGFLWNNDKKQFVLHFVMGYNEAEINLIKSFINTNREICLKLIQDEKTFSSISKEDDIISKEQINNIFDVIAFVISPILPQQENKGFLFVGTQNSDIILTEGDEELIMILATQLGQALENARLFEKTWSNQQELENKVTERTQALSLALEEVKKISKRKTDFVSSVSHELRTPLTSIKGYAAILLTGKLGILPPEVKERLEKINRHSDELVHMVNDLLDISRIESGRMSMKLITNDLSDIIAKVYDLLSGQLKEKQLDLVTNISSDAKSVLVDRTQIERVFINIFGNAMKFTKPGGKISVNSSKKNGFVEVGITDTGCGIPAEALESIFDEFYRVDNLINQEAKGTGLGLALVKHIVEAHGGKIWATSKIEVGTTFSFTLPEGS